MVRADLVDLVQHEQRVVGLRPLDALDDLARQGADIGAPMTAYLGLVMDTAEADPNELLAHGSGNGLRQAGLADSRRPGEAQDRLAQVAFGLELAYREVLQDTVFDLFEAVMVVVQGLFDRWNIQIVFRGLVPGHGDEPVQIGPGRGIVGGTRRHALQAVDLAIGLFQSIFRHMRLSDLGTKLVQILAALVTLTQLFLECFDLLAQVVLALSLVDLRRDLRLQLRT